LYLLNSGGARQKNCGLSHQKSPPSKKVEKDVSDGTGLNFAIKVHLPDISAVRDLIDGEAKFYLF
jgi:hypothetical protein